MKKGSEPKYPGETFPVNFLMHSRDGSEPPFPDEEIRVGLPLHKFYHVKRQESESGHHKIRSMQRRVSGGPHESSFEIYMEPAKSDIRKAEHVDSNEVLRKYNTLVDDFISGDDVPIGRNMKEKILLGDDLNQVEFDVFCEYFNEFLATQGYHHVNLPWVMNNL